MKLCNFNRNVTVGLTNTMRITRMEQPPRRRRRQATVRRAASKVRLQRTRRTAPWCFIADSCKVRSSTVEISATLFAATALSAGPNLRTRRAAASRTVSSFYAGSSSFCCIASATAASRSRSFMKAYNEGTAPRRGSRTSQRTMRIPYKPAIDASRSSKPHTRAPSSAVCQRGTGSASVFFLTPRHQPRRGTTQKCGTSQCIPLRILATAVASHRQRPWYCPRWYCPRWSTTPVLDTTMVHRQRLRRRIIAPNELDRLQLRALRQRVHQVLCSIATTPRCGTTAPRRPRNSSPPPPVTI